MNRRPVSLGLAAISMVLVACQKDSTQAVAPRDVAVIAPPQSGPQSPSAQAPQHAAPSSALGSATAPSPSVATPEAAPTPPPIECKTENDCWFDDARKPIARPAKFRGKKIVPCKTGEHSPACVDGACVVRAWKC